MNHVLHIVINDESLMTNLEMPMCKFLEDLNLHFLQIKDVRQFDKLLEYLPDEQEVMVWVHPNAEQKKVSSLPNSGEAAALALKTRKGIAFNLLSRYPSDIGSNFLKQIGKEAVNVTDVNTVIEDSMPQRVKDLRKPGEALPVKAEKIILPEVPKTLSEEVFDVAIIAALYDDEYTSLKEFLDIEEEIVPGFETLKKATVKGTDKRVLVDFQSKMGMIDAAVLSTQIVDRFKPSYLVMVGVCGGRAQKGVSLRDILIPQKVFDYQSGKYEAGVFKPYMRAVELKNKKISTYYDDVLKKMKDYVQIPSKEECGKIKVHKRSLACGNVVVKTTGYLDGEIARYDEEVEGVEMESFGVVRAAVLAYSCNVQPIIIKAVMDYTEMDKSDKDKAGAAYYSACFAYFLIKDYLLK